MRACAERRGLAAALRCDEPAPVRAPRCSGSPLPQRHWHPRRPRLC